MKIEDVTTWLRDDAVETDAQEGKPRWQPTLRKEGTEATQDKGEAEPWMK